MEPVRANSLVTGGLIFRKRLPSPQEESCTVACVDYLLLYGSWELYRVTDSPAVATTLIRYHLGWIGWSIRHIALDCLLLGGAVGGKEKVKWSSGQEEKKRAPALLIQCFSPHQCLQWNMLGLMVYWIPLITPNKSRIRDMIANPMIQKPSNPFPPSNRAVLYEPWGFLVFETSDPIILSRSRAVNLEAYTRGTHHVYSVKPV